MKCPQCGKKSPEKTNFCAECGYNLSNLKRDKSTSSGIKTGDIVATRSKVDASTHTDIKN